jgi:hypothetical protein
MRSSFLLRSRFKCSVERAFKAPILGDATRFMTGYLFQPPVTGFEDDASWGLKNGIRYPVSVGNLFTEKGRMFRDEILERKDFNYWKWKLYEFELKALFFVDYAIGEWEVISLKQDLQEVRYTYTYYTKYWYYWPLVWLFVNIQIRGTMKRALKGIMEQAEDVQPFIYDH